MNIANGLDDGAGYWTPLWSPDGKRLAMLSTKNGNICPWVWNQADGLRQVTDRAVDLLWYGVDHPFYWISPTTLLVPLLPKGVKADEWVRNIPMDEREYAEAQKTWTGRGVAVSVLSSGVKPDLSKRRQSDLVLIDVDAGESRTLTTGLLQNILVSPDRKAVALLRKVEAFQPEVEKPLEFNVLLAGGRFKLDVISLEGKSLVQHDDVAYNVIPESLRWSLDSNELAFLTYTIDKTTDLRLGIFAKSNGTTTVAQSSGLDPYPVVRQLPQLEWTSKGWIVLASRSMRDASARGYVRRDWWLISGNARPSCITCKLKAPPTNLIREGQSDSFVAAADATLWRISPDGELFNLTPSFGKPISRVIGTTAGKALVVAQDEAKQDTFIVDLTSQRVTPLPLPDAKASVIDSSPHSEAILFFSSSADGLRLWLQRDPNSQAVKVFETNTLLQEIKPGIDQKIQYRSFDGSDLSGWALLPPGYERGKRYPLIVWVYPGWIAGPSPSLSSDISSENPLNLQIPAAQGYVVLRPSMPLNPEGTVDDPMLRLTSGVLPAVDKLVELGVADPARVFLMGHSFGGFATFGLVTQTRRFRAAIAMSWASDLISYYNNLPSVSWRGEFPEESTSTSAASIESALRLGGPPWKDFGRYIRNSPMFYVDKVETPLMIICGDLDPPFEGAQQFFMALHRQGKRAEFVRYWGEAHVPQSPPNIRDMWERIFGWFDEFSPKAENKKASGERKAK